MAAMKVGRMIFFILLILLNGLQDFNANVNGLQDFHEIVKDFTEKKGLKIFHQNVRGLFTNFTLIQGEKNTPSSF